MSGSALFGHFFFSFFLSLSLWLADCRADLDLPTCPCPTHTPPYYTKMPPYSPRMPC
ncbi:hypothetical protein BS50DRAFT_575728 [Corynespora cassiicola Philippines]|uniref:Uncharacterized protein n=1 Tax=Corynespora cassiicola Philippines TaxID=1448308 RepID=A0A2T2NFS2_CORCC|nr:hypothetical protein BS50DRAFT_575728 [Corynespora cassiicola Philippines]